MLDHGSRNSVVLAAILLPERRRGTPGARAAAHASAHPAVRATAHASAPAWRARSPLYRNEILQVNTRWKALVEIYTKHSFAPFLESIIENCSLL